ncbi:hypothetical protein HanPI659440_Chr15g0610571 [Helianthus annuus]|nr:hypothetical protein HanPI659440_Chr15g0610571 [Helianthus annuus]
MLRRKRSERRGERGKSTVPVNRPDTPFWCLWLICRRRWCRCVDGGGGGE